MQSTNTGDGRGVALAIDKANNSTCICAVSRATNSLAGWPSRGQCRGEACQNAYGDGAKVEEASHLLLGVAGSTEVGEPGRVRFAQERHRPERHLAYRVAPLGLRPTP